MIKTDSVEHAMDIRRQLAGDPHRPRYHFLAPANWMNDPNGFIHWQGQYHMFYQHHPFSPLHANMHWGHAVSTDLVHWQDLPIALAPTPGGPDRDGVWSGCAVDQNGVPTLVYTGVFPEVQCIASGSPDLIHWTKHPANPVIPHPEGMALTGFRDPCLWREDGVWFAVIGSGFQGQGGTVLLYRSSDLLNWEYLHPILVGEEADTGVMWECPSFFKLGNKHVLIVSVTPLAYVEYFVGDYHDKHFTPDFHARLDYSGLFYAPQTITDAAGRRLMVGWLREDRDNPLVEKAGWSGMHSVPRVLTLRPDGRLNIAPAAELQALRGEGWHASAVTLSPESANPIPGASGRSLEIEAEFEPAQADRFGLRLLRSPGGEEETRLVYDRRAQTLSLDRSRSCAQPTGVNVTAQTASLALADGEALRLRVFLDGSAIEVFTNGHTCLTTRVYPSRSDSLGLECFAEGGSVTLKQIDVWKMASIWPEA